MSNINYLTLEEVLLLHEISIKEFGGSRGVRDMGLFESAVMQAQQGFGGSDLYPSLADKASILAYALCKNHPFIDGNKRTAALAMLTFIDLNGYEIAVPKGEIHRVILNVADGTTSREELSHWIETNIQTLGNKS